MRHWLIKVTTGASVLFVGVGLVGFVWARARPETLSDTLVVLIVIELPLFFFGVFWLASRIGLARAKREAEFAAKHPALSGNLWLGASILIALVLFAAMLLVRR